MSTKERIQVSVIQSSKGYLSNYKEPVGGGGLLLPMWTRAFEKAWQFKGQYRHEFGSKNWYPSDVIAAGEGLLHTEWRSSRIKTLHLIKREEKWVVDTE